MATPYSVSLDRIVKEFSLSIQYTPKSPEEIYICSADVNRPGLQLSGFFQYFDNDRVQIMGKSEYGFINEQESSTRLERSDSFLAARPPAIIFTRGIEVSEEFLSLAQKHRVPVLRTTDPTSSFMSALISFLNVELAPRITRHGVLVEVYGEGLLMLGESGVGKSETAIELVKRGHRLIADDAVEIRRVSSKTLVGTAPDNIRHFVELRGVGIINARRIFGMGSIKMTEKIDMIIQLEQWDAQKVYDRMGLDNENTEILGLDIPSLTIPVKPGRNLAIIIEVAAMNNRQKKMGFNAAQELLHNLGMSESADTSPDTVANWGQY